MKYFKHSMYAVLLLLIAGVACEVNSDKFPVDFVNMTQPENTGAFARVVQSQGGVWNLVELGSQEYSVTLEFDDAQNGGQVESLSFYVGYSDNAAQAIGDIPADSGDVFRTFQASDFTMNEETGLPRVSTTFTSQQLMDELGIDPDDVGINASFTLRWQITTSTGKKFGPYNSGLNITGGAFYNSPFAQNITISLAIAQDQYVGTYQLEQDAASTSGSVGLGDGYLFGPDATTTVELKVDPANTLNGRVFKTNAGGYLDGLGFGTEIDSVRFAFTQNPATGNYYTTLTNQPGTGLTCQNVSAGIVLGSPQDVSLESSWTPGDDSQFGLTIVEDALSDCAPPNPITFTLTKQQ